MARFTDPLRRVRVAAPCPARWAQMRGDERVRFCDQCQLHVYNLSALTRREAVQLIRNCEDRLCIRFYRRADGTIITRNCPVGLRALKQRVSKTVGLIFAAVTSCLVVVGLTTTTKQVEPEPFSTVSVAQGYSMVNDAAVAPFTSAGTIASGIFLFFYPLLKIKERIEAKRREALRIWRRS